MRHVIHEKIFNGILSHQLLFVFLFFSLSSASTLAITKEPFEMLYYSLWGSYFSHLLFIFQPAVHCVSLHSLYNCEESLAIRNLVFIRKPSGYKESYNSIRGCFRNDYFLIAVALYHRVKRSIQSAERRKSGDGTFSQCSLLFFHNAFWGFTQLDIRCTRAIWALDNSWFSEQFTYWTEQRSTLPPAHSLFDLYCFYSRSWNQCKLFRVGSAGYSALQRPVESIIVFTAVCGNVWHLPALSFILTPGNTFVRQLPPHTLDLQGRALLSLTDIPSSWIILSLSLGKRQHLFLGNYCIRNQRWH